MDTQFIYELIGYLASALVAISLMMSKIVKLRIVNMLGAITFTVYGLLINSYPVAGVNAFIVFVNVYYLAQIYTSKEYFKLIQVSTSDEYLIYFLEFYENEINKFQPGFSYQPQDTDLCMIVLRDMIPAGVLIGETDEPKTLTVKLDFVIPRFRDFKIGRYLFHDKKDYFLNEGITTIRSKPVNKKHNKYLKQMGFRKDGVWYKLEL